MKQGNNKNRNRGHNRNNNFRNNHTNIPSKNQVFESNGPFGKIRGNLMQLIEKYLAAGKDAVSQDDIILAENCFQHADHYTRLYNIATAYENSRREEQIRQQQIKNENDNNSPVNAETSENNTETVTESDANLNSSDTEENDTEYQTPTDMETTIQVAKHEENKIADLPFLNTSISLSENGKTETPEKKRITLRGKKKQETLIANDTDMTETITVTDATA